MIAVLLGALANALARWDYLSAGPSPAGNDQPNNFGDTLSSGVAGPIAGVVILLLGIATVLLIRNMNSRLRRLPKSFDKTDEQK
ncbi:MAG: hypothetical protein ACR2JX_01965 [Mycobacteriales bacterium]